MTVILNGSFTTAKERPGDFDLLYEAHSVQPRLLADWLEDPAEAGGDVKPMHNETLHGNQLLELFLTDRDGIEKGVVRIRLSSLRRN